jgi:hypothetical protein
MVFRKTLFAIGILLAANGCDRQSAATHSSGVSAPNLAASGATPEKAVFDFLEAIRTGNDQLAAAMLTPVAREKTAEAKLYITPRGSATAKFQVGEIEYVTPEKDGAHVWSRWTDVDEEGHSNTDDLIWVLRKEAEGWRVAGTVMKIFPDQPPVVFNFEDPDDMLRKQELINQEILARQQSNNGGGPQATRTDSPATTTK